MRALDEIFPMGCCPYFIWLQKFQFCINWSISVYIMTNHFTPFKLISDDIIVPIPSVKLFLVAKLKPSVW